ncbi:outer membrane protein assembly factor BamE [Bartonella sp. DGB1]|uniref:outer membrane protein assembly factor BamE n=1 Tax=Bartonella sp. DGB1 TaxID=3239807 RepID=UPI003523596A
MLKRKNTYKIFLSLGIFLALSACADTTISPDKIKDEGYIFNENSLKSVPIGASKQQVIAAFGTPSAITEIAGEVFYYISQQRYQAALFLSPKIINRKILVVYFDKNQKVKQVAQYGLKDQKLFDFVTQTTPTLTTNKNFILNLLGDSTFTPDLVPGN